MKIKEQIKKFGSKVLNKIEDHLATVVAGGIILIISTLCIFFWKWLKAKHSLEMCGWTWIITIVGIILLQLFFFWIITAKLKRERYSEEDIKNFIKEFFDKKISAGEKIFLFKLDDSKNEFGVDKDIVKKLFKEVVNDYGMKIEEGDRTIRVIDDREEQTYTQ